MFLDAVNAGKITRRNEKYRVFVRKILTAFIVNVDARLQHWNEEKKSENSWRANYISLRRFVHRILARIGIRTLPKWHKTRWNVGFRSSSPKREEDWRKRRWRNCPIKSNERWSPSERFKEDADTKRFIRIHRAQTMRLLRFGLLEVRPESSPLEPVSGSLNLTSSGERDSFDDISRYRWRKGYRLSSDLRSLKRLLPRCQLTRLQKR